jgi:predicted NBD/HSP70 family sugar kinase
MPIFAARILNEMVWSQDVSRKDLCEKYGVSKSGITQVVGRLIKSGFIEEGSLLDKNNRGRKTVSLRVRGEAAYFLGTDLEGLAIRACLIDCQRNIIASSKRVIGPSWSVSNIMQHWSETIEEVIESSKVDTDKIVGAGLGLPGTVDIENTTKTRAYLPPGKWAELDLASLLSKFGLESVAADNVFCAAEYERRLGAAIGAGSFLAVLIRYGIGSAIFADGSFLSGEKFLIGEMGHMRLSLNGPKCICGQNGCLDAYVSGRTWVQKDMKSDAAIQQELRQRAKMLAIGLSNILKIFFPKLVVIDGIYNDYEYEFGPWLAESIADELQGVKLPVPRIVFGDTVEFKSSVGAALLAADKFLGKYLEKRISAK